MRSNMFIPTKLKIGFQHRNDTFTKKLAYIIYYDEKGQLRKEKSWNDWRSKDIDVVEVDNVPTKGYVLNKGVQRDGYWGNGRSVIRVHDPREFEFEISVDNLIGVLMHGDCCAREIQQECVFAWYGTDLVLLPTNSVEYQSSVAFTEKQSQKISAKSLIKGASYQKRKSDATYVYLGYFDYYDKNYNRSEVRYERKSKKQHVFAQYNEYSKKWNASAESVSTFAVCTDEQSHPDYASMVDSFYRTINASRVVAIRIEPITEDVIRTNSYSNLIGRLSDGVLYVSHLHRRYTTDDQWQSKQNIVAGDVDKMTCAFGENSAVITNQSHAERYNSYGYYYNRRAIVDQHCVDLAAALTPEVVGKSQKDFNFDRIIELFAQYGYGRIVLELENGNVVDY